MHDYDPMSADDQGSKVLHCLGKTLRQYIRKGDHMINNQVGLNIQHPNWSSG
jgi:hypothetical protein